jgi:hypothetical protein
MSLVPITRFDPRCEECAEPATQQWQRDDEPSPFDGMYFCDEHQPPSKEVPYEMVPAGSVTHPICPNDGVFMDPEHDGYRCPICGFGIRRDGLL